MNTTTEPHPITTSPFAKNRAIVARARRGMSQWDLAKKLGLQVKEIRDMERGDWTPDAAFVERLSFAVEFPLGYFYGPDFEDDPLNFRSSLDFKDYDLRPGPAIGPKKRKKIAEGGAQ